MLKMEKQNSDIPEIVDSGSAVQQHEKDLEETLYEDIKIVPVKRYKSNIGYIFIYATITALNMFQLGYV